MRILKELLPNLSKLIGKLKKNDCFSCVWHIFTDCTTEERTSITAGLKTGIKASKIIEILTRLYPEIDWEWKEMPDNRPTNWSIQFNHAAIVWYKPTNALPVNGKIMSHYSILASDQGGRPQIYDPQIKKYIYIDDLEFEYFYILNGYRHGTRELWEGQLPNRLSYSNVATTPSYQSEMEQIGLYLHHQQLQIDELFRNQMTTDEDKIQFNLIGEDINRINRWALSNGRDKRQRRILNDSYMILYNRLLKDGVSDLVKLDNPIKKKSTNYSRQPKSKKSKSKHNSASKRKSKRRTKRVMSYLNDIKEHDSHS